MKATLITGASFGIGESFARKLAARGKNLVLVARTEERLALICRELEATHKINAQYIVADLTKENAPHEVFNETEKRELEIEMLINNAGFGSLGEFVTLDAARELSMIDLNIKSLVALTYLYVAPMKARGHGAIVNVASTAAFQPVPFMATYAATKAFVLSFSEALWEELRPHGVKVLALCPGVTETNFFDAADIKSPPMRLAQTPEEVVDVALRGLARGKSHVISGWTNYLTTQSERLLPRSIIARIAGGVLRKNIAKMKK
ncbi:MAG: SDR family NAD(P)-dependent oxidoreductase [Pyrinomonadaceae bacterium]